MKEIILRILRKTSLTDAEKLKEIFEFLDQDDSKFYGFNKLVKLSSDEFKKLNDTYGSIAIQKMIHNLDKYVYETGRKYKSHYMTIEKWIKKDGTIPKIPQTYMCAYGEVHRKGTDCDCT